MSCHVLVQNLECQGAASESSRPNAIIQESFGLLVTLYFPSVVLVFIRSPLFVLTPLLLCIALSVSDVICETKTKDNVFVQVRIAVQYRVLLESAYDAYYRLSDPRGQIQSYVFDVVRSTVPKMELDEAFASKQDIADATLSQLKDVMNDYVSIVLYGMCIAFSEGCMAYRHS